MEASQGSPRVSGVCSLARGPPQTPFQAGDWTKPQSLGRGAGSAPLRRCLHSGALLGSTKVQGAAGSLVSHGCAWFALSQRPGHDVFSFPFSFVRFLVEGVNREIKRRRNYTNPESAHFSLFPRPPRDPIAVFFHLDQCSRLLPSLSALPSAS